MPVPWLAKNLTCPKEFQAHGSALCSAYVRSRRHTRALSVKRLIGFDRKNQTDDIHLEHSYTRAAEHACSSDHQELAKSSLHIDCFLQRE